MRVGWVRLDDGFALHPKVVTLSFEARWGYVEALCYAAKYETDGFVPDIVAVNGPVREALVAQGLWDIAEGGVMIHDYLVYNPSRSEKQSTRDSRRLAGAIGAATRYGDSKGVGVGGSLAVREKESFEVFWSIYPRRVGKRTAEAAFRRALQRGATVTQIIAGAERYRDDPNRVAEFTAHPTTWLNRDGWGDDPLPVRGGRGPGPRKPDSAAAALRKAKNARR